MIMNDDDAMRIRRNGEAVPTDAFAGIVKAFETTFAHLGEGKEVMFHSTENEADHAVALFSYNFPEMPVVRNGELVGWQPPYMAVETFTEMLAETLPSGYDYELARSDTIVVYREFGR